jgi:hypothetical protein
MMCCRKSLADSVFPAPDSPEMTHTWTNPEQINANRRGRGYEQVPTTPSHLMGRADGQGMLAHLVFAIRLERADGSVGSGKNVRGQLVPIHPAAVAQLDGLVVQARHAKVRAATTQCGCQRAGWVPGQASDVLDGDQDFT